MRSRTVLCTLALVGYAMSFELGCSDHKDGPDGATPNVGGQAGAAGSAEASGGNGGSGGDELSTAGGASDGGASVGGNGGSASATAGTSAGTGTSLSGAGNGGAGNGGAGNGGAGNGGAGNGGVGSAGNSACPADAKILCVISGTALGSAPKDSDCDGVPDVIEIGPNGKQPRDTDGDGTTDHLDGDSDGDDIADSVEVGLACNLPRDSDADGIPDYRDTDADQNGILDATESANDTDADGLPDFSDNDDDGDFLTDVLEIGGTAASPRDSDADGVPDLKDKDSDDDGILDRDERASDVDVDTLPNYRDLDSDSDGISDKLEAGDVDLVTAPVDTDLDALPDFLDLDSDGDGLLDATEDVNLDGALDPAESSRTKADTDGDGVTDLIESAAGTKPNDVADNPAAKGNFVFLVPYQQPPSPTSATLDFATRISLADIFLLIDTTQSMGGEIANLQQSLTSLIIPTLASEIDSIGIGVGSYRDFPSGTYGSGGDWPFRLEHRIMTVRTAAGVASLQNAVNGLVAGGGNDYYESSWEALHQVAKGSGNATGGATVAAFDSATAYPTTPVAGESIGSIPGVGFRSGALPIAILFSDAPGHNTDTPTVTAGDYASPVVAAHSTQVIDELKSMSARVIGIASGQPVARADSLAASMATGSVVPPAAWGTGSARPAGCSVDQCCTGLSGAGEAVDSSGTCPMSFRMSDDGTGLGAAVVTAIEVLTTFGTIDVSAHPIDDPSDSVDAVAAFIDGVVANPAAGAPCDSGLTAVDRNGDGRLDTFVNVSPGKRVCFDVIPKVNRTVPAQEAPQMFKASVVILGDEVTTLDNRNVFFLVPPASPQ